METNNLKKIVKTLRILYPFWVVVGIFSLIYVPSAIIDMENPTATANNISENGLLFRFGILGSLVTQLFFVIIPLYLYRLFEKVDQFQAILMLALALVSIPITMYNDSHMLTLIDQVKTPEVMMQTFEVFRNGMTISMIFWGLWLFPLARLVNKSGYFPKIFGYFLYASVIGYTLGAILTIVSPGLGTLQTILELLTMGEVLFILWFVIKGIKLD